VTELRLGVLGCGTVGAAFVALLAERRAEIRTRTGLDLTVGAVAVRDTGATRAVELAAGILTDDAAAVVASPDVDIVVELIGGIEPARTLVLSALEQGRPVVTGNKALLATHGVELLAAASSAGTDLLFEAAVAGGIPLMRVLRESLVGERVRRMLGIVNGTTNFILTKMTEEGADYGDALAEAQRLGYAEADPTADVEGHDAGAKAAIMAMIAFRATVGAGDVHTEGISTVGTDDIEAARRLGHVIKLLAVVEEDGGAISARVHPAMVPVDHPLAAVRDSFNAVFVVGDAVDELMLYGRGAGGGPTASAVLGDVIEAADHVARRTTGGLGPLADVPIRAIDDTRSAFFVRLAVIDRPGVLAAVAGVFGAHGVSIRSMEQRGSGGEAQLDFITHVAREADLRATLADLADLDAVERVGTCLRVVADE
jgi:homoserine dehydrogenase